MNRIFIASLFINFFMIASGQSAVKEFHPTDVYKLDLTTKRQNDIERRDVLLAKKV